MALLSSFDFDPLALRPSKPPAFQPTVLDLLFAQAFEQTQRRQQGGALPLPGPSLVEPLWPFGLFGQGPQNLQSKTGFAPFHFAPNVTLRELFLMLLQGGQFRI